MPSRNRFVLASLTLLGLLGIIWSATLFASPVAALSGATAPPQSKLLLSDLLARNILDNGVAGKGAGGSEVCPEGWNEIACENLNEGTPEEEWEASECNGCARSYYGRIQGFATDISVNRGGTITFKIKTVPTTEDYTIDIYRMGYYGGDGARLIVSKLDHEGDQSQPACAYASSTRTIDCYTWEPSASWEVPSNAVSGIYFARLSRSDNDYDWASHIFFVVRDDLGESDLLFQTSDTTWQAYNHYGDQDGRNHSLYDHESDYGRAYKVSYNRPFLINSDSPSWIFATEYPMVRWLERNGYDVSYFTGVDSDRYGSKIADHKVFLSVGHDEYWSAGQRSSVADARDAGVHLAFFSGNEVFWKTRWEDDGEDTPYRTLACYKETHEDAGDFDPDEEWTGTWRDPRYTTYPNGAYPENALTGQIFKVNGQSYDALKVPEADGKMRLWRHTDIQSLSAGQVYTFATGTLGYEWDEDSDNGFRPGGVVRMSTTTEFSQDKILKDYGSNYGAGSATHHLTLYRKLNASASSALIFGAGTVDWSWGLDNSHTGPYGNAENIRLRQATLNLFADMGAQPDTRESDLTAATVSTDTTGPSSLISTPSNGAVVQVGTSVTITGTATDASGAVGGVELSFDNGTSWHPADGHSSWSYNWMPENPGSTSISVTIRSRAVDDSGNLQGNFVSTDRTVTVLPRACPCTIWSASTVPAIPDKTDDSSPVELGFKFRPDINGYITKLRFYKGSSANGGTHVGSIWTTGGTRLGYATFTGETSSGWQEVTFATPITVTANITYVASYHAPQGHYSVDRGYMGFAASGHGVWPIKSLQSSVAGGNGVYTYYSTPAFPSSTFKETNYGVDVVFVTSTNDALDKARPVISAAQAVLDKLGVFRFSR
ncbi:MAG TPA: N,N-dimethylformamidase beta subunit family domain-containing protein [Chloroflexia bacterium]|nr:N,N-dimethylformamidase beta subunit family domain-containing protein [Chloroflexia bacterium]